MNSNLKLPTSVEMWVTHYLYDYKRQCYYLIFFWLNFFLYLSVICSEIIFWNPILLLTDIFDKICKFNIIINRNTCIYCKKTEKSNHKLFFQSILQNFWFYYRKLQLSPHKIIFIQYKLIFSFHIKMPCVHITRTLFKRIKTKSCLILINLQNRLLIIH